MLYFLLFICSYLELLCSTLIYSIGTGFIILPVYLFKLLCLPLIHFAIIGNFIKKQTFKKNTILFSVILFLVTIVLNDCLLSLLAQNKNGFLLLLCFDVIWAIMSGLLIVGNSLILKSNKSRLFINAVITIEAIVALAGNILVNFFITPVIKSFDIDAPEVIIWPLCAIMLCVVSYFLGKDFSANHRVFKLIIWFIGVAASVFVVLWLSGTPHEIPIMHPVTTAAWIIPTVIAFLCAVTGMCLSDKSRQNELSN